MSAESELADSLWMILDLRAARDFWDRLRWPARYTLRKRHEKDAQVLARLLGPDHTREVMADVLETWVDEVVCNANEVRFLRLALAHATRVSFEPPPD